MEVGIKSPRVELASEEHNDEALRLNLELLDERREQVQRRTKEYQRKTARYCNQKVKPISYTPGDLVLKKLLPARKNPACHAPNPGPTRLADPNRFLGRETQD